MNSSDHLLVMRLSAMGDVAMAVPVISRIREQYPGLRITILTRGFFKTFFRDVPGLEFISPDFKGKHKGLKGLFALAGEIKKLRVTHCADLHDVLRTQVLRNILKGSGVRVSVIDKDRQGKRRLTRYRNKVVVQLEPTVERYADTVRRLGLMIDDPVPPAKTERPLPEKVADHGDVRTGKWIGIAPFAQHKGKIYPLDTMSELIGMASLRYEKIFIFGGGDKEKDYADAIAARFPNVISAIGVMGLSEELDLIANLDAMVTMDSSSMHMASLVATPAVSVWGATHPYAGFYGFGQDPANAVQLELECRPCSVYGNKPCRWGDYRCMARIAPQEILDRVDRASRL